MIVDRPSEIDALELLARLLRHDLTLPAVGITVAADGSIRLDTAAGWLGGLEVERWAEALGAEVQESAGSTEAADWLGAHPVTVSAAA